MKKILITGFDPFGGENVNPAFEAIKSIKDRFENIEVIKLEVPTVFNKSIDTVVEKIEEIDPYAVILVGQAGGRYDITVERIGINIDDARIKDNEGNQPIDVAIDNDGLPAYFATLPIKAIVDGIKQSGVPASVSNTAGSFVCNHLLYGVLNYIYKNNQKTKAGFIHVPYLPEQTVDKKNVPSMSKECIVTALEVAIEVTGTQENDIKISGGTEF